MTIPTNCQLKRNEVTFTEVLSYLYPVYFIRIGIFLCTRFPIIFTFRNSKLRKSPQLFEVAGFLKRIIDKVHILRRVSNNHRDSRTNITNRMLHPRLKSDLLEILHHSVNYIEIN